MLIVVRYLICIYVILIIGLPASWDKETIWYLDLHEIESTIRVRDSS